MMSASVAGRLPARSRLGPPPPRRRAAPPARTFARGGLPLRAIGLSVVGHVVFFGLLVALMTWTGMKREKVYVVNLAPAVAAVGVPTARPAPVLPTRAPTPAPPARTPAPEAPRQPAPPREAPRLPEPSTAAATRAPSPPALPRAGEKELPPLAGPRVASPTPTPRPEKVDRPVESRPAPSATLGQRTGSPTGVGSLSLDVSDFPHAWYLRQVLQKVQGEWQRQNRAAEPEQKPLVLVEIQRDGTIVMPRIEQSSGNGTYDQAALRAVVDASPFPPLPQDWSRPSLRVMFRFDLAPERS
jgi:protein TonB